LLLPAPAIAWELLFSVDCVSTTQSTEMRNEERTFIGDEAVLIAVHVSNELVDLLLRQLTVDWADDVLN